MFLSLREDSTVFVLKEILVDSKIRIRYVKTGLFVSAVPAGRAASGHR